MTVATVFVCSRAFFSAAALSDMVQSCRLSLAGLLAQLMPSVAKGQHDVHRYSPTSFVLLFLTNKGDIKPFAVLQPLRLCRFLGFGG